MHTLSKILVKKIKTTFVVSLLCALMLPSFGNSLDGYVRIARASDEAMAIDVLGTATESSSDDLLSGNFFLVDDNIGQDLYNTIQKRVRSQGSNVAITKTTSRRGLSKSELYAIIPGSNIGNIMANPDPLAPLTSSQITSRRVDLIADLADEKDLADFESLNSMQVETTEMFANGDESDSGFDLLVDLDVIQAILFNKEIQSMPGQGGGGGGRDSDSGASDQSSAPENPAQESQNNSNTPAVAKKPSAQAPVDASKVDCPTDSGLNAEIEKERNLDRANGAPQLDEKGNDPSASTTDTTETTEPEPIKAAKAGDWHRELPCDDVFCIKLELRYKTESSFTVSDNCVLCHVQKINESFNKLLSHNLVPNKITGNLLEGPKCKDALYKANWLTSNIIVIGQPILTPPNDDLIIKGDIWANMKLFWQRYVDVPKKCDEGEACRISTAEQVLSQSKPNATFDDTTTAMAQEDRAIKNNKIKEYRAAQLKRQVEAQAGQYSVIMQEMTTMNDYFDNFMKTFDDLTKDPKTSPCGKLTNIEYCQ